MPDENDNTIETGVAQLPAARRVTEDAARGLDATDAMAEIDLDERQRRLGTRRKPAGPDEGLTRSLDEAQDVPADVPPTDVQEAREVDLEALAAGGDLDDDGGGGEGGAGEPLESSERE